MRNIIPKDAILVPEHAKCVFKGQIFDTYQWDEKMFDGTTGIFEMLKRPDSVEVLVVEDNKILVQKQEQPFLGHFWSFPGGRHDYEAETEFEACKRELKEETGYVCKDWKLIHVLQSYQKIESFLYIFVALDIIEQVPQQLDPGEKIENIWMSLKEVEELNQKGEFRSSAHKFLSTLTNADEVLNIPAYNS